MNRPTRIPSWNSALAVVALPVLLFAGCSGGKIKLPTDFTPPPASYSLGAADAGPLAVVTERVRPRLGPGESAFLLIDNNAEALRWRLMLIDSARESLDVQYYFWFLDDGGALLMDRVLAAADRGVRVRILLDDFNLEGAVDDELGKIFEQHPNIRIKIFNPVKARSSILGSAGEFLTSMRRLNQRMHNKMIVADGHLALVGGRNQADQYWGLGEVFNNVDLDLLAAGPVLEQCEEAFDLYWNHELSFPISVLEYPVTPAQLEKVREEIALDVKQNQDVLAAFTGELGNWSERLDRLPDRLIPGKAKMMYDLPATDRRSRPTQLYEALDRGVGQTIQEELVIVSAFFVPQQEFVDETLTAVDRGVKVKILTNSLASNRGTVSHAGYQRYRRALLLAGAELYELRPDAADKPDYETPPRQGASVAVHSKAFVVDRRHAFVGSLNLDPRAVMMNTESGILVDSEELAAKVLEAIERNMTLDNSWQVRLNDRKKVEWVSEGEVLHKEPVRDGTQRFLVWMTGALANENWL